MSWSRHDTVRLHPTSTCFWCLGELGRQKAIRSEVPPHVLWRLCRCNPFYLCMYIYIYIPITSYHYKHCTSIGHIQYLLCYRFALTGFGTFHLFPCCTHQIAKCPPHHPSHRSKKCRTHVEAKNSLCSSLTALLSKTRSLWKSLGQHGMMGWNCPEALLNTRAYSSILVLILHKLHKQGSV